MSKREPTWIEKLVQARALVPLPPDTTHHVPGGVVLICDSETDPNRIVSFGVPDSPVCLIANEAGVLVASPSTEMSMRIGLDVDRVIMNPVKRAKGRGMRTVILCLNTMATGGDFSEMNEVELVDHLLRAASEISRRVRGVDVQCVVHVPSRTGTRTFRADAEAFRTFYATYEVQELGRNDEAEDWGDEVAGRRAEMHLVEG